MIRRPPRSTLSSSSAASDVYKRQGINAEYGGLEARHVLLTAACAMEAWTVVENKTRTSRCTEVIDGSPSSKQARKNQRRKQTRRNKAFEGAAQEAPRTSRDEVDDLSVARALEESLVSAVNERSEQEMASIRINRIRKKLTAISMLEAKAETSGALLSEAELAKLARKPELEADLAETEADLAAQEAAAVAAVEEEKKALESVTRVNFDMDRFGCPICTDVMDAATTVLPCQHTFCRECIEVALSSAIQEHMNTAERIAVVVCPLCRTQLFNEKEARVLTKPALKLRKRIAKAVGTCHCGAEVPLSTLRDHLRNCGPGGAIGIYPERKQYKNEFEQPPVVMSPGSLNTRAGWKFTPRAYDEDQALQDALAESLQSQSI
eukprot:TRINITY_DN50992_c0_g1_i1.p1 TRINITY_DN50992_c0_g1~~TRINITY_DN50992_c0_g1_i1.p1  ORF type:complete len:379 (-),score=71.27 TRINITY_DN50992_c0_g1_i1:183-1319(-)